MARLRERWRAWWRRVHPRPSAGENADPPVAQAQATADMPRPPMSIAAWLGEDETQWVRKWRYPADPAADDPASSAVAIGLSCTPLIIQSMTPMQRKVHKTLLVQAQEEFGLHCLLPNVMDELLWLARQPWWDKDVAGVVLE